jgi:uncharacterized protein
MKGVSMLTAEEVISLLHLTPLRIEGGYFIETYRSGEMISGESLPGRYSGPRSMSTAIYYLLTPGTFSEIHRVNSDEIFHFYLGDPVEMLELFPDGSGGRTVLGGDLAAGQRPQKMVPAGAWQGTRLIDGGTMALLGTTVSPGFSYEDYTSGGRIDLALKYPRFEDLINKLTR